MNSREHLNKILSLKVLSLLNDEGFKSNSNKSTFERINNDIIQTIQFVGSNNNYKGVIEKYSLTCHIKIPKYPDWYLKTYKTTQTIHHQTQINDKMLGAPPSKIDFKENWDESGQIALRYDLLAFDSKTISESINHNVKNCILPYFYKLNSLSKIAKYAKRPLDAFDYYVMSDKKELAKSKLEEFITQLGCEEYLKFSKEGDFQKKHFINWVNMTNLRISLFFPQLNKIKLNE